NRVLKLAEGLTLFDQKLCQALHSLFNPFKHFYNGAFYTIRVEPAVALQFKLFPVFDNRIRYSKPAYLTLIVVVSHKFENRTTEATLDTTVFDGNYLAEARKYFVQQSRVKRFRKAHVVVGYAYILTVQPFANLNREIAYMPQREDSELTTIEDHTPRTNPNFFHGRLPVGEYTLSSRIAN